MNRLSFRMILFILVLSAVHMAGMAPLADSPEHRLQLQPATSRATPLPDHLQAGSDLRRHAIKEHGSISGRQVTKAIAGSRISLSKPIPVTISATSIASTAR
jgi:hypothetical protein